MDGRYGSHFYAKGRNHTFQLNVPAHLLDQGWANFFVGGPNEKSKMSGGPNEKSKMSGGPT
jgi:hypothetical protein